MIRKLKLQLAAKEKELHRTRPGSAWQRIRLERNALRLALEMAMQERVQSRAEQSAPPLRSPEHRGAA